MLDELIIKVIDEETKKYAWDLYIDGMCIFEIAELLDLTLPCVITILNDN